MQRNLGSFIVRNAWKRISQPSTSFRRPLSTQAFVAVARRRYPSSSAAGSAVSASDKAMDVVKKIRRSSSSSSETVIAMTDNPCWGSPTAHGLRELLQVIPAKSAVAKDEASSSILYDSKNFMVLNKPPDLRMDGAYPATVHKLLNYWYPSPSLLERCRGDHETLLDVVSQLHRHCDLEDNFLRPCHQLDYATSGILLVAKTQEAAGYVGRLFQDRREGVQKTYLAIVAGDLKVLDSTFATPWEGGKSEQELRQCLQTLEDRYRKTRFKMGKEKRPKRRGIRGNTTAVTDTASKNTFQGYQPPHAMYVKWKAEFLASTSTPSLATATLSSKKRRRKLPSPLSDEDWSSIWKPVREALSSVGTGEEGDWTQRDWKELRCSERCAKLKGAVIEATNLHNNLLREALIQQRLRKDVEKEHENLPTVFTLKDDTQTTDTFYVYCPLADDPDGFRMQIPNAEASPLLDFKPSMTKCKVLERGTFRANTEDPAIPVTKVLLTLFTGRRHQLRVHMALAGVPILGDATYGNKDRVDNNSPTRMCLHAHRLQLPLPDVENWEVVAPDPFPFNQNGELQLKSGNSSSKIIH